MRLWCSVDCRLHSTSLLTIGRDKLLGLRERRRATATYSTAILDTPCITLDLDRVRRNLSRWQSQCDALQIRLRSHVKTHKTLEIASMQVEGGAAGIACQTLGEAEIYAAAGFDDILLASNVVGGAKLSRLSRLLLDGVRLTAITDDERLLAGLSTAAEEASRGLRVMVDCDTGGGRTGVGCPEAALQLAKAISARPRLTFEGLCTHPCSVQTSHWLTQARDLLNANGLQPHRISIGGTSQFSRLEELTSLVNEYRAGNYVYLDRRSIAAGVATLDDIALTVLSTVVSRPTRARAVLDAGSKSLTNDGPPDGERGYGLILESQDSVVRHLYEEHAVVDLATDGDLHLGARVHLVPNHSCPVSNLVDHVWVTQSDEVVGRWKVAARGRSS